MQQWVCKQILRMYPELTEDDVRSCAMGSGGVDVQLSAAGKKAFPFDVEAKNQEGFTKVYNSMEQAKHNSTTTPIVVIKSNRKKPLVVMEWDDFEKLIDENK